MHQGRACQTRDAAGSAWDCQLNKAETPNPRSRGRDRIPPSVRAADADSLADLYHLDAVNHQVTQDPVEGRDAIRAMFEREFATADMICIVKAIHEAGDVVALEWRDSLGLRGCGFFTVHDVRIAFQRGYWDKLSFLKVHGLPVE
jgi:limonene-1,2-epoxide hydrolase